jgi:acyl carrier protein
VVELVMAIEEAFDIEISDEDAEAMHTVGDIEKYVTTRVAA